MAARPKRYLLSRAGLLAALLVILGACGGNGGSTGTAAAISRTAGFSAATFDEPGLPVRDYYTYIPAGMPARAPLVVYLHGCNQDAPDAALGTRWPELAQRLGFALVFPDQKDPNEQQASAGQFEDHLFDGNGARCWNWFRPEHIARDGGEAGTIAGITRVVMAEQDIDPKRVYIMGISAGGIMAGTMAANYPDLYAAVSIVAGCSFPACSDASGRLAYVAMGAFAARMPVIVFQGTADEIQPYATGREAGTQWLGTNDYVDDGSANQSVSANPSSTQNQGFDERSFAGAGNIGDVCIRNSNSPCLAGAAGIEESYPYTVERFLDANGCPLEDFWTIHGLAHNYPGGNPEGSFTDPYGPDITTAAYNFFLAQARGGVFELSPDSCR